jgi:hypothetical protein
VLRVIVLAKGKGVMAIEPAVFEVATFICLSDGGHKSLLINDEIILACG